jgi:serine/threonine-protein phosphatase 6 regulatory ankyrin repeat subunit B
MASGALKNSFNKPSRHEIIDFINAASDGNAAGVARFLKKYPTSADAHEHGTTALMMASRYGQREIVELLIKKGADVHAENDDGYTALTVAVAYDPNIVDLLLKNGADFNYKDKDGRTVLMHLAAHLGNEKMLALLLDKGADLHEKDKTGTTVLMMAANHGHSDIVDFLLEKGMDINEKNNFGDTALMYAAEGRQKDIVNLLTAKGAAMDERSAQAMKTKRKNGESFSVPVTAVSRLVDAAEKGDLATVTTLLDEHGATIINQKNPHGWMALTWAAHAGHSDMVELLLDRGADIDAKDGYHMSALIQAAAEKHRDVVELLLKKRASTEGQDKANGMTALMWAVANEGSKEIVEMLLEHGADFEVEDNEGETALMQAEHGEDEIADLLRQWPEKLEQRRLKKEHEQWLKDTDFSKGLKKALPAPVR